MKYTTATVQAAHAMTGEATTIDLDGMSSTSDLVSALVEAFPPMDEAEREADEDNPDEVPARVRLSNPEGFAVHLFMACEASQADMEPVPAFDDLLSAWNDEADEDRREAMGEYLDDMGADTLADFDEAYSGQYSSGADFAESLCYELGAVPKDFPSWISIDWEHTWKGGLRHDYHITDSGHVFRRL